MSIEEQQTEAMLRKFCLLSKSCRIGLPKKIFTVDGLQTNFRLLEEDLLEVSTVQKQ